MGEFFVEEVQRSVHATLSSPSSYAHEMTTEVVALGTEKVQSLSLFESCLYASFASNSVGVGVILIDAKNPSSRVFFFESIQYLHFSVRCASQAHD